MAERDADGHNVAAENICCLGSAVARTTEGEYYKESEGIGKGGQRRGKRLPTGDSESSDSDIVFFVSALSEELPDSWVILVRGLWY